MNLVNIIVGSLLLAFGRRLFWLFVGVAGFVVGMDLAGRLFPSLPEPTALIVGVIIGLIAVGLAIFIQKIAIAIAGFLLGGFLLTALLEMLNVSLGSAAWLPYLIGGILGVILIFAIVDWALIILSSLAGAVLVVQGFAVAQLWNTVLVIVLTVLGILFQARILDEKRKH